MYLPCRVWSTLYTSPNSTIFKEILAYKNYIGQNKRVPLTLLQPGLQLTYFPRFSDREILDSIIAKYGNGSLFWNLLFGHLRPAEKLFVNITKHAKILPSQHNLNLSKQLKFEQRPLANSCFVILDISCARCAN